MDRIKILESQLEQEKSNALEYLNGQKIMGLKIKLYKTKYKKKGKEYQYNRLIAQGKKNGVHCQINLGKCTSVEEVTEKIISYTKDKPEYNWVLE